MLPKAILFDLDDTILRFTASGAERWAELCVEVAPRLPGVSAEQLRASIRSVSIAYWNSPNRAPADRLDLPASRRVIVKDALNRVGVDDEDFAVMLADEFSATRDAGIRPFPGAVETLARLRTEGARLALLTNGDAVQQRGKIDRFDLARFFDCIVIEGEFGAGKPEPKVYRYALNELQTAPEDAWMVGDNLEWEVIAPQRLGIYAVWCDHAGVGLPPDSLAKPDRTVRSIAELLPEGSAA